MSLLDIFTEKDINKLLYLPNIGISNNKVNSYNNFINDQAKIFFTILNNLKLNYYVFAGSSIGLIRNQNNIPWVDDYDVILFEADIKYFETKVIPIIKKHFFEVKYNIKNNIIRGVQIYSNKNNFCKNYKGIISKFQCDFFYTCIDKNNIIKNLCNWGLYDKKNININLVKPQNYQMFNGIYLPFFSNYINDVAIEYGNIIDNVVININHGYKTIKLNNINFNIIYDQYYNIENTSKQNTLHLIDNTQYTILDNDINNISDNDLLNNYFINFYILSFIKYNNISTLIIKKNLLMKYVYNIKHYYPNIIIIIDIINFDFNYLINLNYVDIFNYYTCRQILYLNNKNIIWLNKPNLVNKIDNNIISNINIIEKKSIINNIIKKPVIINTKKLINKSISINKINYDQPKVITKSISINILNNTKKSTNIKKTL